MGSKELFAIIEAIGSACIIANFYEAFINIPRKNIEDFIHILNTILVKKSESPLKSMIKDIQDEQLVKDNKL